MTYLAVWWGGFAGVMFWLTTNTAPGAPELKWKEEPIITTTKLAVEIAKPSEDPDPATEVEYHYTWTVDGQPATDENGEPVHLENVVDSKLTLKGQVWEVTVTPDDGSLDSSLCVLPWHECAGKVSTKLSVTIADSAPRARIVFRAEDGKVTSLFDGKSPVKPELSCADPDASEAAARAAAAGKPAPEGDPCTYKVAWFPITDAPPVADAPPAFTDVELPAAAWKQAEAWRVVVIANDGELDGPPVEETVRKG